MGKAFWCEIFQKYRLGKVTEPHCSSHILRLEEKISQSVIVRENVLQISGKKTFCLPLDENQNRLHLKSIE